MESSVRSLDELFLCANINKIEGNEKKDNSNYFKDLHTSYDWEILLIIERIKNYRFLKIEEKIA